LVRAFSLSMVSMATSISIMQENGLPGGPLHTVCEKRLRRPNGNQLLSFLIAGPGRPISGI
jgi:hypothetical protein